MHFHKLMGDDHFHGLPGALATLLNTLLLGCLLAVPPWSAAAAKTVPEQQDMPQSSLSASGQSAKDGKNGAREGDSADTQPWVFGGNSAAAWGRAGIGVRELKQNALPAMPSNSPANTTEDSQANKREASPFSLSVESEQQSGDVAPTRLDKKPDEEKSLESQHRVRAFATVQEDNLSIGLGPEFIVRDSNHATSVFKKETDQPDLDAGVGMQLKIDF